MVQDEKFNKDSILLCKELLEQMVKEELKFVTNSDIDWPVQWEHWVNVGDIRKVLKMLDKLKPTNETLPNINP